MLEFCRCHGFLVDFLLWSHELKWCRISYLSVTGKAQNSWENWKIHVFNAIINGQAHWVHLTSVSFRI